MGYEVCGLQTYSAQITFQSWPPGSLALSGGRRVGEMFDTGPGTTSQGTALSYPPGRRPLVCPFQVTMLFQRANESCQTKSHFKSTLCKKHVHYSTFHLLIMPWTGDQSGRNLSVLEINGFVVT